MVGLLTSVWRNRASKTPLLAFLFFAIAAECLSLALLLPLPSFPSARHTRQNQCSPSGSSSISSGGLTQLKWKLRGHPSQQMKWPRPSHVSQNSLLPPVSSSPLAAATRPCAPFVGVVLDVDEAVDEPRVPARSLPLALPPLAWISLLGLDDCCPDMPRNDFVDVGVILDSTKAGVELLPDLFVAVVATVAAIDTAGAGESRMTESAGSASAS